MMDINENRKEYLKKIENNEDREYQNPFIVRCEYCKRTPEVKVKGCTAELIKVGCACQADIIIKNEDYIKKMKSNDFRLNLCKGENCPFGGQAIGPYFCKEDGEWFCRNCYEESHREHQVIEGNVKCDDHPNEEGISFCKNCSKVFCLLCKDSHINHAGIINLKVKRCEKRNCGKNAYKYCCNCERWWCNDCIDNREQEHKLEFMPEILQICNCGSRKPVNFYCKSCKYHICYDSDQCKDNHRHQGALIDIRGIENQSFEDKEIINFFEEKIHQVEEQIQFNRTKYLLYKAHLKKKIKELKDLFIKNDFINKNIYTLMNSLLTTYKKERSYYMLYSIKEMCKFNIHLEEQFKEQERFNEIDKSIEQFKNFLKYDFALSTDIPNYFYDLKDCRVMKRIELDQSNNLVQLDRENLATCGKGSTDRQNGKVFVTYAVDEKDFLLQEDRTFKHNDRIIQLINYICTRPKEEKEEKVPTINPNENPEKYNDIITCGASDNLIRIWTWKQDKKKFVKSKEFSRNKHDFKINKIILINTIDGIPNRFATCSDDTKIKIWTLYKKYKEYPLMTITGSNQAVKSIIQLKNKNILISASIPNMSSSRIPRENSPTGEVRIWDISESSIDNAATVEKGIADCKGMLKITCGYPNSLMQVEGPVNDTVFCGSNDGHVYIIEGRDFDFKIIKKIQDPYFSYETDYSEITFGGVSAFIQLQDQSILCGCPNGYFVQICDVGKKSKGNENTEEDGFIIISHSNERIFDCDVIDFKNIAEDERIYCYALSISGRLIQYKT